MTTITDEFMRQILPLAKDYCVVILKAGPNRIEPGVEEVIWEHGRRNFALHAERVLSIVCPISDGGNIAGVGIFNADVNKVKLLMDEDPGVKEGVFVYDVSFH